MTTIKKIFKSIILFIFLIAIGIFIIEYIILNYVAIDHSQPLGVYDTIYREVSYRLSEPKVPKPYSYEKAFEILKGEIENNDELNFEKADENFEINECFFLRYNYISMQNERYSGLSLLSEDYFDSTNIQPNFIDKENKIAIILTNKKAWKKKKAYHITLKNEGIVHDYNVTYFEGEPIRNSCSDEEMTEKTDKIYTVFALYNINFIEEEGEEKARKYIRTIPQLVKEFRDRLKQPYGWYGYSKNMDLDRRNIETTSE